MIRYIVALVMGLAVLAPASSAHADPKVNDDPSLYVARIDYLKGDAIKVTLSDGRHKRRKPCVYEDSPRCYWNASTMGNGRGNSFIVIVGRVFYINL